MSAGWIGTIVPERWDRLKSSINEGTVVTEFVTSIMNTLVYDAPLFVLWDTLQWTNSVKYYNYLKKLILFN